jgi:hypothetical protein
MSPAQATHVCSLPSQLCCCLWGGGWLGPYYGSPTDPIRPPTTLFRAETVLLLVWCWAYYPDTDTVMTRLSYAATSQFVDICRVGEAHPQEQE